MRWGVELVDAEALRPGGRGLMGRSRVGGRGVASGVSAGCLCARRLYARVGVPGLACALGGDSGTNIREGSVRVRRSGLLTCAVFGEGVAIGRQVEVQHRFKVHRGINSGP